MVMTLSVSLPTVPVVHVTHGHFNPCRCTLLIPNPECVMALFRLPTFTLENPKQHSSISLFAPGDLTSHFRSHKTKKVALSRSLTAAAK